MKFYDELILQKAEFHLNAYPDFNLARFLAWVNKEPEDRRLWYARKSTANLNQMRKRHTSLDKWAEKD